MFAQAANIEQIVRGAQTIYQQAQQAQPSLSGYTVNQAFLRQQIQNNVDNKNRLKETYDIIPNLTKDEQQNLANYNEADFAEVFNQVLQSLERSKNEITQYATFIPQLTSPAEKLYSEAVKDCLKVRNKFRRGAIDMLSYEKKKEKDKKDQELRLVFQNIR